MAKHFNFGMVLGVVVGAKQKKSSHQRPYLQLRVGCKSLKYGYVATHGQLWGEDKIKAFLEHFKEHPRNPVKFRGVFSQYDRDGVRHNSYSFWDFLPAERDELRATFVLRGDVVDMQPTEGTEWKVFLRLNRQDCEEERFELYAPYEVAHTLPSGTVEVKGVLMKAEDLFGMPINNEQPCILEARAIE